MNHFLHYATDCFHFMIIMINSHFKLIVNGLNGKLRHGRILEQPAVKLVVGAVEAITDR